MAVATAHPVEALVVGKTVLVEDTQRHSAACQYTQISVLAVAATAGPVWEAYIHCIVSNNFSRSTGC